MTDEQKKLVEDNHSLIYLVIRNMGLTIEDNYDLAAIGLCKAAISYNLGKFAFSTYAYRCMENEIKQEFIRNAREKRINESKIVSADLEIEFSDGSRATIIDCISSKESTENEALSRVMYSEVRNEIGESDSRMLPWFAKGYTQMEIANIFGVSQANVSRVKRRVEKLLCCD